MRYLIALVLPPLALLMVGKPIQAVLNLLLCLTLYGIPVSIVWALCVVASAGAEKRNRALIAALKDPRRR